ncbi:hypothetical protein LCGC14_0317740 [marine sediment metagenome]|uniref:Uncharacterized protein n=1 Tax=marine sediment metagenome TaxID=412755 RepID=A0A0F9TJX2_9ZZZZ
MGNPIDNWKLDELINLTEKCHEVTVMWFAKEGRPLKGSDPNGSPDLMLPLLKELKMRRMAQHNMKIDEAMRFVSENENGQGATSPEALSAALKMTVADATALMIVLEYADMIERRSIGDDN